MLFHDRFRGRRVLVTGHTGFKGSWLSLWLLRLGAELCGFSNGVPTEPSLFALAALSNRLEHRVGDIRDAEAVEAAIRSFRPDIVFHMAAQPIVRASYTDPVGTITSNVVGTAHVLDALRRVDWPVTAVIITSDKCYDNVEWVWGYRETDALGGRDVYSGSKAAAEIVFRSYWHSFFGRPESPVRLATVRAGNVIGGGDWAADRIVADCVRAWGKGERVPIRSPAATRPWQHVLEPLSGYLTLAAHMLGGDGVERGRADGESFNFGPRSEQNRTVVELLGDLGRIWGFASPGEAYEITGDVPFHEAGLLKLNCDKALLELGWEPNLSYDECMGMTGLWYRGVLREGAGAAAITDRQIAEYERLAAERRRVWTRP